ncbi:MAG: PD-(D/E)XK nuclease family protein [Bacteroidota bacterium]
MEYREEKISLSNLVRDHNLEKLDLSLKAPNFFNILKATKSELKHSNFLAWLLTPNESHNLGAIFLKWFLKEVFSSDIITWATEFTIDSTELHSVEILREWNNIDILILHDNFVLAIENKIDSSEHSNQLNKYFKKVSDFYKIRKCGFIFLTVDGINPASEEDQLNYVPISYEIIKSRIEIVLDVYSDSLSERVKYYIEDYLLVLKREIMKEHEAITLAREIYKNHKQALDFIFENKPDKIFELKQIIESAIETKGFKLQTCHKYYARFLTKNMVDLIPRTGNYGWKGNESFLFEMAYHEKGIALKFVIAPGNEHNRQLIGDIIKSMPSSKRATGKKWLTYFSDPRKVNFQNEKYEDEKEVVKLVHKILDENIENIEFVENEIKKIKDRFE